MAQSRAQEEETGRGTGIVSGESHEFAEGQWAKAGNKEYKMPWLAQALRTKRVLPAVIGVFLSIYAAIVVNNLLTWLFDSMPCILCCRVCATILMIIFCLSWALLAGRLKVRDSKKKES
jgi:hypothetical protein